VLSDPLETVASFTPKRDHIALILRSRHNIHGISWRAPRLSPLMCQPLLETCLRIPTWLWPQGGVNRALARSAFASELPAPLRSRTVKPGPDSFIRAAFERNRTGLHTLLREGLLPGTDELTCCQQAARNGVTCRQETLGLAGSNVPTQERHLIPCPACELHAEEGLAVIRPP